VAYQWAGRMGKVQGPPSAGSPEFQPKNFKIIFPLQWVKFLTDLRILGCELHKNAIKVDPRPPSRYKGGGEGGKGKEGLQIGRGKRGRNDVKG